MGRVREIAMSRLKRFDAGARRWLLIYAALPLAYIICGRLGLLLAVPPGYATAVFLPAGIAVAAMLMAGAVTLPATFLGSLLLNIWIGYAVGVHIGIVSIAVAVVIALASMLQAAIGGTVLRRAVGYPAALDNPRDLLLFLVLAPIFCFTSATFSLSGMWALGTVQSTDLLINWMTWWVGDTLGVLVALPLMLVIGGEPRSLWRSRGRFVAVPMVLCFGLFVAIFIRVNSWENDQSLLEFRLRSQQLADTIKARLEEQLGFLDQLSNVFVGRYQPVSRQDFDDLVQTLLRRFPTVQAVEWAPRVTSADRATFEAAQRAELPGFLIRQRTGSGELRAADDRSQFYPVTYLEPLAGNEPAVGFDLLSDPIRRVAIESTVGSGDGTATAPVRLVQERGEQSGILLTHAVPGGPTGPGIVLVVLRMGTFASTLANPLESILNLRFADTAGGPHFFDNMPQSAATSYEIGFNFGGRHYVVTTMPTSDYLARHRGWESWAVLAVGVLGTGLLGALLMLGTGHTYRIEGMAAELKQLATIVETSRDAIWSWATDGTITSWNSEAEQMLGYTAEEILGKSLLTLIPSDRIEAAHGVISKMSRGQGSWTY
jgi:PAS domain-containing protein